MIGVLRTYLSTTERPDLNVAQLLSSIRKPPIEDRQCVTAFCFRQVKCVVEIQTSIQDSGGDRHAPRAGPAKAPNALLTRTGVKP